MIYVTGDTHRDFKRIKIFCERMETTKNDLMIILGDAGINYCGKYEDDKFKNHLESLPIKFLCVRGNHEERPENIPSYKKAYLKSNHFEGMCFYEQDFPSLYFLDNGLFYLTPEDDTKYSCLNINGAYSVDKWIRLKNHGAWFKDEQLSDEEKADILQNLPEKVNFVFSHTCPKKFTPTEMFLPDLDQTMVDHSMEEFLDKIEDRLEYKKWYCGHWHADKWTDKISFLFNAFDNIA